jgi:hypothetical protein
LIDYYARQAEILSLKKRYPFNRPRESQMDVDSETIPSPPSTIQRETNIIPTNLVSPVDITRDITMGHKMLEIFSLMSTI